MAACLARTEHADSLFAGLTATSRAGYLYKLRRWFAYCRIVRAVPINPDAAVLTEFARVLLHGSGYSPGYVRGHFTALRFLHRATNRPDPLDAAPAVELLLRAGELLHTPQRAPFVPLDLFEATILALARDGRSAYGDAGVVALAFAMRRSELWSSQLTDYIRRGDVSFHNRFGTEVDPHVAEFLTITFRRSKNDRKGMGTRRTIARIGGVFCAVAAAARLVLRHGPTAHSDVPLASTAARGHLDVKVFLGYVNRLLIANGAAGNVTAHSFRVTCINVMSSRGVAEHVCQHWGRWTSEAFRIYLRSGPSQAYAVADAFRYETDPDARTTWTL